MDDFPFNRRDIHSILFIGCGVAVIRACTSVNEKKSRWLQGFARFSLKTEFQPDISDQTCQER